MAPGKALVAVAAVSFLIAAPAFAQTPEQHFEPNPQSDSMTKQDGTKKPAMTSSDTKADLKSGRSDSGTDTLAGSAEKRR